MAAGVESRKVMQRPAGHTMERTGETKIMVSKKARISLCASPSSTITHLVATVLFAMCYSVVKIEIFSSAWGFLPTTRNTANNNCLHYVSRTKQLFGERGSVGDAEWSSFPSEQQQTTNVEDLTETENIGSNRKSRISSIRCENFAGMTNGQHGESLGDENVIVLDFDETITTPSMTIDGYREENSDKNAAILGGNLVCVTGETGSGKSLLVSKVAELLTGGKASTSLLHKARNTTSTKETDNDSDNIDFEMTFSTASVEMVLSLYDEVHISFASKILRRMGLDPTIVMQRLAADRSNKQHQDASATLRLKRVISMNPISLNNNKKNRNDKGMPKRQRMKSICFINGQSVPLKVLKAIASPLVAVVNAPVAASALGRPVLRLSMIDSGIPPSVIVWVHRLQTAYRECKQYRRALENDLKKQVLPTSMVRRGVADGGEDDDSCSTDENNEQLQLLRHWIEELDGFERRISDLQDSLCSGGEGSTLQIGDEELEFLLSDLNALDWSSSPDHNSMCQVDDTYTSSLYETLLDLHDYLKSLDARITAAIEARESLASLSASDSARAALDRTRQLLLDAAATPQQRTNDIGNALKTTIGKSANSSVNSRVGDATEKAHEMLNLFEDALSECANFLDDDEKGLVAILRASRRSCSIRTEELSAYITEWNLLARKHGVSPYQLPLCHKTLKREIDGGVEARRLLPEAKIAENDALNELEEACRVLTEARIKLCQQVSTSISRRLPRLGMENSKFEARLSRVNNPSYSKSHLGADEVAFYLLHEDQTTRNKSSIGTRSNFQDRQIGGKIENVASAGEKARLLLAIECEIPGSISAIGRESLIGGEDQSPHISPVAVIYDEIDAHVGGRASVSVAQMLFDQSKACQVLSITHSPSLAAIADTQICVQRGKSNMNGRSFDVVANRVEGAERRKELARMASGDMVVDEAESFAEALLRDAQQSKLLVGQQHFQP